MSQNQINLYRVETDSSYEYDEFFIFSLQQPGQIEAYRYFLYLKKEDEINIDMITNVLNFIQANKWKIVLIQKDSETYKSFMKKIEELGFNTNTNKNRSHEKEETGIQYYKL